jgi:glycosyltransferase involved in cell wall biosynthesis
MSTIIFVNRFFYPDHSATSQILSDLAFHLGKLDHSIHVVTSRQVYENADAQLPAEDSVCNVHVIRIWTTCLGRQNLVGRTLDYLTFYLSAAWILWRILRQGDVVVAKTDPPLISVVAGMAAKLRGATFVSWTQDLFPEVAEALEVRGVRRFSRILRAARNWSLRSASANVVIGERMAARLREEGISSKTITVIHNWADGCAIQPIEQEGNELRVEWGLRNKFVVGYSGNFGRAHEFETILGAVELLKGHEKIAFLFIGGGAQQRSLEMEVNKRGLSNILFKPYQPRERLAHSLSVPDVHLVSLRPHLEGLVVPSKFYGIAAAGRPTLFIGDPKGEIPRLLEESSCGHAVAVGDSQRLADHVLAMASGNVANEKGVRAREAFEKQFDQKLAFAAWEDLLLSGTYQPRS